MKIATLTFQRHDNIGAMLQCYALQTTIINNGFDNEIIDYICDAADRTFGFSSFKVKGLKKYITSCIGVISRLPKKRAFIKFRKEKLIMTKKVDNRNIHTLGNCYDGYIVGSDNVWNSRLTGLDVNYFLDFVKDNQKKASYAASMGFSEVPKVEHEIFKSYLNSFPIITLREKSLASDIERIVGKTATDACDPTFFLNASDWDKLAIEPKTRRKYVLVYQMSPSYSFVRFARDFAKRKNLAIVYVPFPYGLCKCSMKPHIGPCEWLGYVKNASYILTDSFHGCVFASIYERNLIIKISQLGERINNLTKKLGIENRIVSTSEEAVALPEMDYTDVRKRIDAYRKAGKETLMSILRHFENIGNKEKANGDCDINIPKA